MTYETAVGGLAISWVIKWLEFVDIFVWLCPFLSDQTGYMCAMGTLNSTIKNCAC